MCLTSVARESQAALLRQIRDMPRASGQSGAAHGAAAPTHLSHLRRRSPSRYRNAIGGAFAGNVGWHKLRVNCDARIYRRCGTDNGLERQGTVHQLSACTGKAQSKSSFILASNLGFGLGRHRFAHAGRFEFR
ncbi:hypothetical protein Rmet_6490 [Cupriavidus metallidurans CH34]|uniref:Uncharacterized protein n=1 Tax=Cupriavidus metallidurans (strain ATCC 43123 / DSM 2839 / NBRC 102507 / CH34) TaxID=266264 RepID=D3DXS8_CUPMC|nr:hypothetical protein Rmet_6490 [Cupriavidus metallidurans CH34]